jgi:ABC-2 type transport system permease protein
MNPDFVTVLWKEWKEIFLERSSGGSGLRPLFMVALIGILVPLQMGPDRYFRPRPMWGLMIVIVCLAGILAVVPDAFAGERERHTLETLLASRLTDRAILFGKLAACLAYGWLLSIITVALGIITVNVANWNGHVLLYRDAATWLALILLPLLVGGALASTGVFVSLRAATVRQAQQTLIFAVSVSVLAIGFGIPALPQNVKSWFAETLAAWSAAEVVLAASLVVLAVDVVLVLFALARFQRSKLVLD